MKAARLENWILVHLRPGIYVLTGDIFGDQRERWEDGTPITTSEVVRSELSDVDGSHPYAVTLNTYYYLGTPAGGTRMLAPETESEYDDDFEGYDEDTDVEENHYF